VGSIFSSVTHNLKGMWEAHGYKYKLLWNEKINAMDISRNEGKISF